MYSNRLFIICVVITTITICTVYCDPQHSYASSSRQWTENGKLCTETCDSVSGCKSGCVPLDSTFTGTQQGQPTNAGGKPDHSTST